METFGDLVHCRGIDLRTGQQHFDAVLLVLVAELAEAQEANLLRRDTFACELLEGAVCDLAEQRTDPVRTVRTQPHQACDEVVATQVAHQHPPGREHVGRARNDDFADPELGGEGDRVHPTAGCVAVGA